MTFNIYELGVFVTIVILVTALTINNIRLYVNNKKLLDSLIQTTLEKLAVEDSYDKLANEYDMISMQETDGFVKFLSDSRESAFAYIEEVQASIKDLSLALESNDESVIKNAYDNLLKHMPKEEPND